MFHKITFLFSPDGLRQRGEKVFIDSNADFYDFACYLEEFSRDCDINFFDLDICALIYDYLLQEVRSEIEDSTGKDVVNETIYVFSNYLDSQYDCSENPKEIALQVPKEIRSDLLEWFISEI